MAKTWKVQCDEYTSEHRTKEDAEAQKERLKKYGRCSLPHEIVPPEEDES